MPVVMSPLAVALLSIRGSTSRAEEMRREIAAQIPPEAKATVHQDIEDLIQRAKDLIELAMDCENRGAASLRALDMLPPKQRVKIPYEAQLWTVMAGGVPDLDKEAAAQWAELEAACQADVQVPPVETPAQDPELEDIDF